MAASAQRKFDCGVYAITHVDSGKRYIGSSKNIEKRLHVHKWQLNHKKHYNFHLQGAWNKWGEKSFNFAKILVCNENDRLFYEQLVMDGYNSIDKKRGYNLSLKATHPSHSPETRKKIGLARRGKSTSKKGVPMSEEQKQKCRISKLKLYKDPIFLAKHNARKPTHCYRGHPFSGDNLYIAKDGERGCRACMAINRKAWKVKNREKHLALKKAYHQRWKKRKKA